MDEARAYLREDFALAESIERWGQVRGVGPATLKAPHRNFMNAPWWTDGNRLVMLIATEPVPLEKQAFFFWDWSLPGGVDQEEINRRLRELVGQ